MLKQSSQGTARVALARTSAYFRGQTTPSAQAQLPQATSQELLNSIKFKDLKSAEKWTFKSQHEKTMPCIPSLCSVHQHVASSWWKPNSQSCLSAKATQNPVVVDSVFAVRKTIQDHFFDLLMLFLTSRYAMLSNYVQLCKK